MSEAMTDTLLQEYETMIADLGEGATDKQIVAELTSGHNWTEEGSRAVLMLARTFGTAILRNALALALAMEIEDGDFGL